MRQYSRQMGKVAFVYGKKSLRPYGLEQTVEDTAVEVTGLIVHSGHDCVCILPSATNRSESWFPYLEDA